MTENLTAVCDDLSPFHRQSKHPIAMLMTETLRRGGEKEYSPKTGGFLVQRRGARHDGIVECFGVFSPGHEDRDRYAIHRYYEVLKSDGWLVSKPAPEADNAEVEVIGDTLMTRAPQWLCEKLKEQSASQAYDTSEADISGVRQRAYRRQLGVASLIAESLERAGEKSYTRGRRGGYYVSIGATRWDGFSTDYFVECTDFEALGGGALDRYASALGLAGWFVKDPAADDTVVHVEVVGNELLNRAPLWLCQRWEELEAEASSPGCESASRA
jgi:hypothetical protein